MVLFINKLTNLYINSTICDKKERVKEHFILNQIVKYFCDAIEILSHNILNDYISTAGTRILEVVMKY